jgi:hypothetical protein
MESGVHLPEVGQAIGASCGLLGFVERGKEQRDEDRDDADDDEELDEGEGVAVATKRRRIPGLRCTAPRGIARSAESGGCAG